MNKIKKILYVEDEVDIQVIVKIALCDIGGFTIETCSSGKEALEKIEKFDPDLILLDVMMPEMDGPETLKQLRKLKKFASIPVIFVTAKIQEEEINEYKRLGAIDIVSKPFDPLTLADQIKNMVENNEPT
jgi:CheY-like chemotaxis protein